MLLKTLGKNPSGDELKKVEASANYKNKSFQNLVHTAMMEDTSMLSVLWKFMNKPKNAIPPKSLPSIKTNLKNLPDDAPVIIWFGHS
ncbi:MAG: MBL fold metallo-hydrolase, partial [Parafilimonas sp.]